MEHREALLPSGQRRRSPSSWPRLAIQSRIELLKEVMPRLSRVAVILNADNPATGPEFQAMETTAQSLNVKLLPFRLRTSSELVSAFESMEQASVEAVETGDDPLSFGNVGAISRTGGKGAASHDWAGRCGTRRRHDG